MPLRSNFWYHGLGAISYDSRIELIVVEGTMTARQYVDRVIHPVVIPFMNTTQNGIFQQNNAHPHSAAITRQALQSVAIMDWPTWSPDLFPIEHVWDAMGRLIMCHSHPACIVQQLIAQVVQKHVPNSNKTLCNSFHFVFISSGNLTSEGIDECSEGLENITVNAIIQKALDSDLREIGAKFLPEDINRGRIESITGPAVLQIQKIRNVSSPKVNSGYSNAPDLLRVQLTDGHTTCNAIQWGNWKSISQDIPPGTKLYLKPGKVKIQNSFLILSENHFTVLGGDVSALIEKWELNKSLACHIRATTGSDGGPPPWIPFGQHIDTNSLKNIRGNFKSLEQTQKEGKENEAFEQQRKATIAEIARAKEGKKKIFGGGKQIPDGDSNISNSSISYNNKSMNLNFKNGISESVTVPSMHQIATKSQANSKWENKTVSSKQDQNIKKREKNIQQSDGIVQSRPSGQSTLFDFLQTQISLPAGITTFLICF
ncbi:tudor domain-containing protein 3-like [Centruroides sculpturatus]|uniref:tudor domain-containing protein 3-like n=1 Tax=Centruroides sculpturatus TaxID=218467 RepID=UPI000C6CD2B5|nr:tudor domain-containing protein 3-like [Centruroides sculpturatus]